jgi:hypothetical protein
LRQNVGARMGPGRPQVPARQKKLTLDPINGLPGGADQAVSATVAV